MLSGKRQGGQGKVELVHRDTERLESFLLGSLVLQWLAFRDNRAKDIYVQYSSSHRVMGRKDRFKRVGGD